MPIAIMSASDMWRIGSLTFAPLNPMTMPRIARDCSAVTYQATPAKTSRTTTQATVILRPAARTAPTGLSR
jgi:hypothetical protein